MNSIEFVEAIIEVVRDATISDVLENLKDPPGRKPDQSDVELSEWFLNLSKEDLEKVVKVISKSVDGSMFGLFAVLDGVRTIEDNGKYEIELIYKSDENSILLNDSNQECLHDVFKSLLDK